VQVNAQSIPAPLRQMAIAAIQQGFQQALENSPEEDLREFQEQFGRRGLEQMVSFIEETETVTVGWGVDSSEGKTFIDLNVTAKAGSNLAKRFALLDGGTTRFAGLSLPRAAAKLHFTSTAAPEDIEQSKSMLDLMRRKIFVQIDEDDDLPNDAARAKAKEVVGSFLDVVKETIEAGKFDGGAALLLNGGKLQLVAGGRVSDGRAVEEALKKLVAMAKSAHDEPNLDKVVFNAESHRGVAIHSLTVPIPPNEEDARKVLGAELPILVGTTPQAVYIAMGQGSADILKSVIDNSAAAGEVPADPMTSELSLASIMEFAATIEDKPEIKMIAAALKESAGRDHITVKAVGIPQGFSYRIQVEDGVLKLIGQAAKMKNAQANR
jgi:hypothetical protein